MIITGRSRTPATSKIYIFVTEVIISYKLVIMSLTTPTASQWVCPCLSTTNIQPYFKLFCRSVLLK